MQDRPSMLKPALISGTLFGFLAGVPFINWINCACCALIVATGFVAAGLHARDAKAADAGFEVLDGLKVALLAAVFYAVAETLIASLSAVLFHEAATRWLLDALREMPDVPPEVLEQLEFALEKGLGPSILLGFVINLGFGVVFSSVGGLIGGAVFRRAPGAKGEAPTSAS